MKLNTQKNNKKIIIVTAIVALIIAGAVGAWLVFGKNNQEDKPENTVNYDPPTSEQRQAGYDAKESFIERSEENEKQSAENASKDSKIELSVSSSNQDDEIYQLRIIVDTLDQNGKCRLSLTREGSEPVYQEAGTQVLGSYSVCKGFDIPTGSLAKGSWQAEVVYESQAGKGVVRQEIEVR